MQASLANAGRPASDKLPGSRRSHWVPLSFHIREFMEPRFEFAFGRVCVHTDRDAIALSRGLNAQAFTHHEDIFYSEGRSNLTDAEFHRGHRLGKEAEAAVLQEFFHDPRFRFNYEQTRPSNTWLNNFVSHDRHYQVFQVVAHTDREIAGGETFVRTADGSRVSQRDAAGGVP